MIYNLKTIRVKLNISDVTTEKIITSKLAYELAKSIFNELDADQEHMIIFSLDSKNQVKGYKVIASGGQDSAAPDFKIIFRNALLLGAYSIILAHNHPSGDIEPSVEDKTFTEKIKEAGELLSINVLDHLIIGTNSFYSFTEKGGF